MENLSLHILDIVENSIRAGAKKILIEIIEDKKKDLLTVRINDNGKGMDECILKGVLDPFFTTKSGKRVGLGLSLLSQASELAEGKLTIDSKKGEGTKVQATFRLSHPDIKPMGEMIETIAVLIASHPEIQFVYNYDGVEGKQFFDSYKK